MASDVPILTWPVAPRVPALARGEIHVWGWSLVADLDAVPALRATLSADECERADRFLFERDRVRFTVAHARMRAVLRRYVPDENDALLLRTGSHGKPELVEHAELRFNLSHSHDLALLAVARDLDLGVDVEHVRPISEGLADRFFAPSESAALRALPSEVRLPAFFTCWTRKEAVLKGVGTGLSGGLSSFAVPVIGRERATVTSFRGDETAGWELEHLEPAEGYVGALAVQASGWSARCFAISD